MSKTYNNIPFKELEFKMFVIDEMCDSLSNIRNDIIKLTLGKSELPLSNLIREELSYSLNDLEKSNLVYPEGLPTLRDAITKFYNTNDLNIQKNSVIINTGTSPLYRELLSLLITSENDEVLIPKPFYSLYYVCSLLAGAKIKFYDIDVSNGEISINSFFNAYNPKSTKLVFLCSPGNPLGNIISKSTFSKIIEIVGNNSFIISDEMYSNVWFDYKPVSILTVSPIPNHNIIVSGGFSKGFRMYTRRVGYFILPEQLVLPFRVIQQHTLLTVDPATQFAAGKALQLPEEVNALTEVYKERRDYTVTKLSHHKKIYPILSHGGFYFSIDVSNYMKINNIKSSFDLSLDILENTGVGVVPGSDFGYDNLIRLSFTNKNYNEAIDRLALYFR